MAQAERIEVPERKPDGTRLIRQIKSRAAILGLGNPEVARELDMSVSYFSSLMNDPARLAGANRRFMRNIARFLGINTVMAYQYAGLLEEEDMDVEVTVDRLLAKSREDIERDPVYGFYIPKHEDWEKQSLTLRLLVSGLYNEVQQLRLEKATSRAAGIR